MTVEVYDSFEEMQAAIEKATAEANKRVTDWQREMSQEEGTTYSLRIEDLSGELVLIVGEFPDYDTLKANEMRLGASEDEADYGDRRLRESREMGYMFGKHYSVVVPEGEWGSAHVSQLVPISKETFEFFKSREWVL